MPMKAARRLVNMTGPALALQELMYGFGGFRPPCW